MRTGIPFTLRATGLRWRRTSSGELETVPRKNNEARIALERGLRFEAKIVDASGKPIAGAMALLRSVKADLILLEPATSSDEGIVTLSAPTEGAYRLVVLHVSYAPAAMPVQIESGSAGAKVVLHEGGKLLLQVLSSKGMPVEGAEVILLDDTGENAVEDLMLLQNDLGRAFVTQVDGYLVLDHAAPGPYRASARKGEASTRVEDIAVREGQVTESRLRMVE